jgi:predicted MFS family arabinose efflux permease
MVLAGLSLVGAVGATQIDQVRRRVGETWLVVALPLAIALAYLALGRWFAVWGVGLMAVQAFANGLFSPFSKELLNREIADSGQRATVLSVESMARRLAFGAFTPVAGWLVDRHGLGAGLYACAAVGLIGAALLVAGALTRRHRGLASFEGEVTPTPLPTVLDTEATVEQIHTSASR